MAISLQTGLCNLLGIEYPLLQAGMAGKITNPKLVAAVSNSGGLGMLGAAYLSPEQIEQAILGIRRLTSKPFGINLFQFTPHPKPTQLEEMSTFLQACSQQLGVNVENPPLTYKHLVDEQIEVTSASSCSPA
jgi:nitronate monooxygenase